jgi:hypothetical protein
MVLLRKETLVAKLKLGLGQVHLMPVHSLQGSPVDQGSSVIPALGHLPSHSISIILDLSLGLSKELSSILNSKFGIQPGNDTSRILEDIATCNQEKSPVPKKTNGISQEHMFGNLTII